MNGCHKLKDHLNHFQMNRLVSDYTLFADFFSSGLKLRLDQTDNAAAIPKEGLHRSQNLGQRDEGHINGCEINGFRNLFRRHIDRDAVPDQGLPPVQKVLLYLGALKIARRLAAVVSSILLASAYFL